MVSKWEGDPWVSLSPTRLQAAMQLGDWRPAALARAIDTRAAARGKRKPEKEKRQTLHALLRPTVSRCRATRRRALSIVMRVPEYWLAGEYPPVPLPGHMVVMTSINSLRAQLAVLQLHDVCLKALRHDLQRYEVVSASSSDFSPIADALDAFSYCVPLLVSAKQWRTTLTHQAAPTVETLGTLSTKRVIDLDDGEAVLGATHALRFMLEPWLRRRSSLDFGRLRQLMLLGVPSAISFLARGVRPLAISRDGQPIALDDPRSPFSLLRWTDSTSETR